MTRTDNMSETQKTGDILKFEKRFLFGPNPNSDWGCKMVLNPAMIQDPADSKMIHMLFRATGPGPASCFRVPGKPLPYPIFLGYAVSRDEGTTWEYDWSCPAFAPGLKQKLDELMATDSFGRRMFDYHNGCIEDPRLFFFEDKLYMTVACRAFPPGPYWEYDDPVQCMPDVIRKIADQYGKAVAKNTTVSLLYEVDLEALKAHRYDEAFTFVAPLHQPDISDDRDVMFFPRRLEINGRQKIACLHRPKTPWKYEAGKTVTAPSIFMAVGDSFADFFDGLAEEFVFAVPEFPWEADRVGASWPPIEIEKGLWLFPYHGKQDEVVGYTQSFMLLRETGLEIPKIIVRPSERLLYASEKWELEGEFSTPCIFTCSGILRRDRTLLMAYGAADSKVGLASVNFDDLVSWLKKSY